MSPPRFIPSREGAHLAPDNPPGAPPGEPLWGPPSGEMLEAEARGEIILVDDMTRTFPSFLDSLPVTSNR